MNIELPPNMLSKIEAGEAVLFLGAGAVYGAKHPEGLKIPNGNDLRDMLCDKFLGGKLKNCQLVEVSELAKNESSLLEVQTYIRDVFIDFEPCDYHKIISDFRWKGIISTNYDLIIEKTYEANKKSLQNLYPIKHDDDGLEEKLKRDNPLIYLKAHGCIKDYKNSTYPLILASEEYAKYKKNRHSIFAHIKELGESSPLIFCGYNLSDPNINEILFDLKDKGVSRPMYVVVDPGLTPFHERLWQANRFVTIKASFEDFLKYIDSSVSIQKRKLAYWSQEYTHTLLRYLKKNQRPSPELLKYVDQEFQLLDDCDSSGGVRAIDFYKGADDGWGALASDLDVKRAVTEEILSDSVLETIAEGTKLFLVKGHAGSGKTIVLKRLAWSAYKDFKAFGLFLKLGGTIKPSLLAELAHHTNCRVNIFISENYLEDVFFQRFLKEAVQNSYPFNIFLEVRVNEWNVNGEKIIPFVHKEYEVRNLNPNNIKELLQKLEKNNCLGYLSKLNEQERFEYCYKRADRQLLVMLYEITSGEPFEKIVINEYEKISPPEARVLYLDICTLHRFSIGVRAGIISRVSGINFDRFKKELFSPLETLVFTYDDYLRGDICFKTRHPDIASIVFDKGIRTSRERVEQIIRLIKCLNLDYSIDNEAFFQLIKGRGLAALFGNRNEVDEIFDAVLSEFGESALVWHQRAVFEMNHTSGSLDKALVYVERALSERDRVDPAVVHTKASILRMLADKSISKIQKNKFRTESKALLKEQLLITGSSHFYHTYIRNLLDELRDHISGMTDDRSPLAERVAVDQCRDIDQAFSNSLQRHPGDEHLLQLKADYNDILENNAESTKILEHAFTLNPNSIYLAIRLASLYKINSLDESIKVIRKALKGSHTSKELNFELAKYLGLIDEKGNSEEIIHCLNRSFTPGDSNYLAQFWFGYYQYMYGDRKSAYKIFESLKKSKLAPGFRNKVRKGSVKNCLGKVKAKYGDYMFVECNELDDDIYVHSTHISAEDNWNNIYVNAEVEFDLGFVILGPCGINCRRTKTEGQTELLFK